MPTDGVVPVNGHENFDEGEGPFNMAVFRAIRTNNAVEFASKWRNVYEIEHLTCISTAYPHLSITYDYAEEASGIYGRCFMKNGVVTKATHVEMESAKREPAFKKLIDDSG